MNHILNYIYEIYFLDKYFQKDLLFWKIPNIILFK